MSRTKQGVPPSARDQLALVAAWMGRIGTDVVYFPIAGEREHRVTKIRSEPWMLGSSHCDIGHTAVILVEGVSGCVALTHVREATTGSGVAA